MEQRPKVFHIKCIIFGRSSDVIYHFQNFVEQLDAKRQKAVQANSCGMYTGDTAISLLVAGKAETFMLEFQKLLDEIFAGKFDVIVAPVAAPVAA